jgi:hypothetical protein
MVDPAEKTRLKALLDMLPAEDVADPTPGPTEEQPDTLEPEMKLRKKRRARMQTPQERVQTEEQPDILEPEMKQRKKRGAPIQAPKERVKTEELEPEMKLRKKRRAHVRKPLLTVQTPLKQPPILKHPENKVPLEKMDELMLQQRKLKQTVSDVSLDSEGWPQVCAQWDAADTDDAETIDVAAAKTAALDRTSKLPGSRTGVKKATLATTPNEAHTNNLAQHSAKIGALRIGHFSRKSCIQHKKAGRWALMVNCAYPKAALPIDIECYRTVMTQVFEYLMTDKTASKEQANKLKVELLRKASDGACLFGAEPPHEEEGVSKEEEPVEEEDEELALELAEDEDSFNVHDWFNFWNWL